MRNPFARRHPECPDCGQRHKPLSPAERVTAAKNVVVTEAVELVVAYPPGTFPRLEAAIAQAVRIDAEVNGPIAPPPGKPEEPPAAPATPVDPIEAEVAKFRAEMDKYPTAEEPER